MPASSSRRTYSTSSFVEAGAVAVVDHLVVVHDLAAPLDRPDADEHQGHAGGEAEADVLGVGVQEAEVDVMSRGTAK